MDKSNPHKHGMAVAVVLLCTFLLSTGTQALMDEHSGQELSVRQNGAARRSLLSVDCGGGCTCPDGYSCPSTPSPTCTGECTKSSCFPWNARVTLEGGRVALMSELRIGDRVRVMSNGVAKFEPVFMFSHKSSNVLSEVVHMTTSAGYIARASPGHLIPVNNDQKLVTFGSVSVGQDVWITAQSNTTDIIKTEVIKIERALAKGLYAPHTPSGTLVVDGVIFSCYTDAISPSFAATMLKPVALLSYVLGPNTREWINDFLLQLVHSSSA